MAVHAGSGVIKVSDSVMDALLAVTVTSYPSVTVMNTVGYTEPVYVTEPSHVAAGVVVVLFDGYVGDRVGPICVVEVSLLLVVENDVVVVGVLVDVRVEDVVDIVETFVSAVVEFTNGPSRLHIRGDPLKLSACTFATNSNATVARDSILPFELPSSKLLFHTIKIKD